jgi:hypothetical protein
MLRTRAEGGLVEVERIMLLGENADQKCPHPKEEHGYRRILLKPRSQSLGASFSITMQ